MVWIKIHPGDPECAPDAENMEEVHDCPCVNDGRLLKAILDPCAIPAPAQALFQLLNVTDEHCERDIQVFLDAFSTFEETVDKLSTQDVIATFSLIDNYSKGYLTPADLQLIFGAELLGKTMEELIKEAGTDFVMYKQLWKHLLSCADATGDTAGKTLHVRTEAIWSNDMPETVLMKVRRWSLQTLQQMAWDLSTQSHVRGVKGAQ